MTTLMPEPSGNNLNEYRITLTVRTQTHPNRWIAECLADILCKGEEVVDWDVQEVMRG